MSDKNCEVCNGTGIYKRPNDEKRFDKLFDAACDQGIMPKICYENALDAVGYTEEPCIYCANKKTE